MLGQLPYVSDRLSADFTTVLLELGEAVDVDFADSLVVVDELIKEDPGELSRSGEGVIVERKRFIAYHDRPERAFQSIACKSFFSSSNSLSGIPSSEGEDFCVISTYLS